MPFSFVSFFHYGNGLIILCVWVFTVPFFDVFGVPVMQGESMDIGPWGSAVAGGSWSGILGDPAGQG